MSTALTTATPTGMDHETQGERPLVIHYTVDGEAQETRERMLTPRQILHHAGIDPATHYLVEIKAHHENVSYEGRPDVEIPMHQHMRFVSVCTGPTPVS
jgi:hypothetical protein